MSVVAFLTKKIELISSFFPWLIVLYRMYYEKVVDKEILLGEISHKDRVLFIGGGPFPCTAIEVARKTNAMVYIVDKDPIAVNLSKNLIRKMKLDQQIIINCNLGQDLDTSEFDVIHIAQQAYPKEAILTNLLRKTKVGARILLRSKKNGLDSFYNKEKDLCSCIKCKAQDSSSDKTTFLITKLGRGNEHEYKAKKDSVILNNSSNTARGVEVY